MQNIDSVNSVSDLENGGVEASPNSSWCANATHAVNQVFTNRIVLLAGGLSALIAGVVGLNCQNDLECWGKNSPIIPVGVAVAVAIGCGIGFGNNQSERATAENSPVATTGDVGFNSVAPRQSLYDDPSAPTPPPSPRTLQGTITRTPNNANPQPMEPAPAQLTK